MGVPTIGSDENTAEQRPLDGVRPSFRRVGVEHAPGERLEDFAVLRSMATTLHAGRDRQR